MFVMYFRTVMKAVFITGHDWDLCFCSYMLGEDALS